MLDGNVVAITGAGRGIGRGIGLMCACEGAKVVVNDYGGSEGGDGGAAGPALEVVAPIREAGGEAIANLANIADPAGSASVIEDAVNAFGARWLLPGFRPAMDFAHPPPIDVALSQEPNMYQDDPEVLAVCKEVTLRASMLMDASDADGLVEMFTEDREVATFWTIPAGSIRGREQLRARIKGRAKDAVSRHVCTNAIADRMAEDEVRVRSYFTHYRGSGVPDATGALPLADALRSVGEYDDRVVRVGGRWLIAKREGRFVFGGL